MKRKRKLGELQPKGDHAATTTKNIDSKQPIDLTLSDDEERVNGQESTSSSISLVVLTDNDDDQDEVLFVKSERASAQDRKKASSSTASSSKTINDVLKDKQSQTTTLPKSLPPLLLSTPDSVTKNTPCSLHYDILPPKLAESLYKQMLLESTTWTKNKWYLNDKLVESNHKTCFYHSEIDGRFDEQWYMGRKLNDKLDNDGIEKGRTFNEEMDLARSIIEEFVNEQLKGRKRYDLEYDGKWKANVAASNCYRGGAEVRSFPIPSSRPKGFD